MTSTISIAEAIVKALDDTDIVIDGTDRRVGPPASCGCPSCEDYGSDVIFMDSKAYTVKVTEVTE